MSISNPQENRIPSLVEQTFRAEAGHVLGTLIGLLGDFDLAEDVLQETLVTALEHWPVEGVPRNPPAWITTTARHKAIDILRRSKVGERKHAELAWQALLQQDDEPAMDE